MSRYAFSAFAKASTSHYIVLWDLQWQLIDCQLLEPMVELSGAMTAAIERLASEGWQAKPRFGNATASAGY
jgi:hypothetical protein